LERPLGTKAAASGESTLERLVRLEGTTVHPDDVIPELSEEVFARLVADMGGLLRFYSTYLSVNISIFLKILKMFSFTKLINGSKYK